MRVLTFREVKNCTHGHRAGQCRAWLPDAERVEPPFGPFHTPAPPLARPPQPTARSPQLTGHMRTERSSNLCIASQSLKATRARTLPEPPASTPSPNTHSTGCPPGKRCICNCQSWACTGESSGGCSSNHVSGSTWGERTGTGVGRALAVFWLSCPTCVPTGKRQSLQGPGLLWDNADTGESFHVPCTRVIHTFSLNPHYLSMRRCWYYLHFTEEETEDQDVKPLGQGHSPPLANCQGGCEDQIRYGKKKRALKSHVNWDWGADRVL